MKNLPLINWYNIFIHFEGFSRPTKKTGLKLVPLTYSPSLPLLWVIPGCCLTPCCQWPCSDWMEWCSRCICDLGLLWEHCPIPIQHSAWVNLTAEEKWFCLPVTLPRSVLLCFFFLPRLSRVLFISLLSCTDLKFEFHYRVSSGSVA